ncbi:MAG TPA: cytochrome c peroxidase [Bacteroidia bacterium]|nr:cytochrome c peroxidase [Bacteroidia bacterium]
MRSGRLLWVLLLAMLAVGCREIDPPCPLPPDDGSLLQVPQGFPEVPFPADNALTEARWKLGKKLFYDPVLSKTGTHSCGSCHKTSFAMADDQATSPGVFGRPGTRNAPTLANVAYHPYLLREGSVPTLEMQVLVPIQEANEFNHNIVDISVGLQTDSAYVRMSMEAYGRLPDPFVITRAISTFERTMLSGNSPYEQYTAQGCREALTAAQIRGMELFFSDRTHCGSCHGGFNFTNHAFENNGLYTEYSDIGRMRFTNDSTDLAKFKVPTLRNVGHTVPYMHDGSLQSLEEVVNHYNDGGKTHPSKSPLVKPLRLSESEKRDLIQFLLALSDERFLNDARFKAD